MPVEGEQVVTPVLPALPTLGQPSEQNTATETKRLSEADVQKLIDAEYIRRQKQSQAAKLRNQRANVLSGIDPDKAEAAIKAAGGDVRRGLRDLALDGLLAPAADADDDSGEEAPASAPGRAPAAATPDRSGLQKTVVSLLNDAGMQTDDPDYLALTKKNYPTESEFLTELAGLAVKRARGAAPASAGAGAVGSGGGIPGAADAGANREKLTAKLNDLMKNPTANRVEIAETRNKLMAFMG